VSLKENSPPIGLEEARENLEKHRGKQLFVKSKKRQDLKRKLNV